MPARTRYTEDSNLLKKPRGCLGKSRVQETSKSVAHRGRTVFSARGCAPKDTLVGFQDWQFNPAGGAAKGFSGVVGLSVLRHDKSGDRTQNSPGSWENRDGGSRESVDVMCGARMLRCPTLHHMSGVEASLVNYHSRVQNSREVVQTCPKSTREVATPVPFFPRACMVPSAP